MISGQFDHLAKPKARPSIEERQSPISFQKRRSLSANNDLLIQISQSPKLQQIDTIIEEDEDNAL